MLPPSDPASCSDLAASIEFEDLFQLAEIQQLQDRFARATGVVSVIARPDGTPITRPSGSTHLCAGIIRETTIGRRNCQETEAQLARPRTDGPTLRRCPSSPLWDASVSIVVGDRHLANWLVGQVRGETPTEAEMRAHARSIGADEEHYAAAYGQVPAMSAERFEAVADTLFTLVQHLSASAYQNVQQRRALAARERAEEALRASEERFRTTIERAGAGYFRVDRQGRYETVNPAWLRLHGFTAAGEILGQPFGGTHPDADRSAAEEMLRDALRGRAIPNGAATRRLADGSTGYHTFSLHPVRRGDEIVAVEGFLIDTTSLRQSRADFEMLFETMLDGFCVCEILSDSANQPVDARFLAVNPAFERLSGRKAVDLVERRLRDSFPTIDPVWLAAFQRVASTGEPMVFERHSPLLNRFCSVSVFMPRPGRLACMLTDISARKLAEIQLRKLSRAVEQSPAMVLITDRRGAIDYVNPSFTATTGYTLDELHGQTPRVLNSGSKSGDEYRSMWETISAGRDWRGEFLNRKKNGDLFWVSSIIGPILDEGGRITHYLAVKEDITERKRAEERLHEQAALLDATQDAIFVARLDRTVTYWNRRAAHMFELSPEAVGRPIETLTDRNPPPDFPELWQAAVAQREWAGERRCHTPAGRTLDLQIRTKVLSSPEGAPIAMLVVVTDLTESKQLEAQFLRAQRLESLGALASGVAHDLNNILTPILISAEMLRPLAVAPDDQRTLQFLNDSARRGADLVQQLLLFGRGSDSPRAPLNIGGTLKEVGQMMRRTFPRNIAISLHAPADLWLVDADRTQIHQVILNLCVNARDAMPGGGRLTATAENVQVDAAFSRRHAGKRTGAHVRLQIVDTGIGIAPEHLEKIFDPFFTTKPAGQGTGLGLATVLGIVRSHEGILDVHSVVGQGTRFEIYLPSAAVPGGPSADGGNSQPQAGKGELILVVEDEEPIRTALQRTLASHGYRVLVASDGAEALGVFAHHSTEVRLLITNIWMPVMDGAQTIRALRRLNPKLPVVTMSGLSTHLSEFEREFGPGLGFLGKPFQPDQALRLVRELLDRGAAAASPP